VEEIICALAQPNHVCNVFKPLIALNILGMIVLVSKACHQAVQVKQILNHTGEKKISLFCVLA